MAAEPKLTNVSIVVVGGKMPQMDLVERLIKKKHEELNDNLVVIDVRKHMTSATPGHAVIEGQDGAWPQTAISVYAHPQFAKLVTSIITFVAGHHDGDNMIVVLKGKTGYHRADVVARTLKDALNSLMEISRESGELAPVFNANMFSRPRRRLARRRPFGFVRVTGICVRGLVAQCRPSTSDSLICTTRPPHRRLSPTRRFGST